MGYSKKEVTQFLIESNKIEEEEGEDVLQASINAWRHIKRLKKLTLNDVLACHFLIMVGINYQVAGNFRTCDVTIGGCYGYPPHVIEHALRNWLTVANLVNTEEKIMDNHIWFEVIHPFVDGNGRTGRLIFLWQRYKADLPFKVIEAKTKWDKYYPLFQEARKLNKYQYKGV